MKLDRSYGGAGKYAVVNLRRVLGMSDGEGVGKQINDAIDLLQAHGVLDFGMTPDTEFFVIKLKDKYAGDALEAYGNAACNDRQNEYGQEVLGLAYKAFNHPNKKAPD